MASLADAQRIYAQFLGQLSRNLPEYVAMFQAMDANIHHSIYYTKLLCEKYQDKELLEMFDTLSLRVNAMKQK